MCDDSNNIIINPDYTFTEFINNSSFFQIITSEEELKKDLDIKKKKDLTTLISFIDNKLI